MRIGSMCLGTALAALAGCLLAASDTRADDPVKPAAARETKPSSMQIQNGPLQTVHYFGSRDMKPDQVAGLRDRERAENEAGLSHQLAALRVQYVANERILEAKRFEAQQQLLNSVNAYAPGIYPDEVPEVAINGALAFASGIAFERGYYGYGRLGYSGYGYGYGYGYNTPAYLGTPASAALSGLPDAAAALSIDEGQLKRELVRGLVDQTRPESVALRPGSQPGGIKGAGFKESYAPGQRVSVTLKSGTKVEGTVVKEDADWLTVDTATGQMRIRVSEVVSITTEKGKPGPK
jgi:hypothetical protein